MFPRRPYIGRHPLRPAPTQRNDPPEEDPEYQQLENQFYPSIFDVLKVRHLLLWRIKPEGLPAEVVDMIVDAAEYWASTKVKLDASRRIQKDVDQAVLSTSPLCYDENTLNTPTPKLLPHRTIHPCRKIILSILSHDQGGYLESRLAGPDHPPAYEGTYTWFDAEVVHNAHEPSQKSAIDERLGSTNKSPRHFAPDDPLLLPRGNALQRNRARMSRAKRHIISWHYLDDIASDSPEAGDIEHDTGRGRDTLDGKQVREMEIGDSIVIWARARFPGWVNYVNEVSVRVFWAI
ncbi:hypothetical protein BDW74DRAFT_60307 [Aspergillus multicolor]|uniref:uncharacterized protein n=1 Tax=Aspergillus multicolor TaxID=41759 RepID=UPI003CCE11A6